MIRIAEQFTTLSCIIIKCPSNECMQGEKKFLLFQYHARNPLAVNPFEDLNKNAKPGIDTQKSQKTASKTASACIFGPNTAQMLRTIP
ncbi:hypothetical protein CEXT_293651 [Caerostris extrusa]|uniref:Uncharacterized protein n=1 Tax=Caerostris extrusa TaxID=172846 RepID=A0AAV4VVS2_CAEEX|nr:hypothetical protein CEXT_293651 [Caerostris extrusa]